MEAFGAWVRTRTDQVDVLVNNAGGALGLENVAQGNDEDWETMMQTNVLGVLRMTRAALPLIAHDDGASIINVGSHATAPHYLIAGRSFGALLVVPLVTASTLTRKR